MRIFKAANLPKMVIFDGKKANMFVGVSARDIAPSLWSDNQEFVKIISTYFENAWGNAEVYSPTPQVETS
jgi:hypothetical protein